MQWAEAGFQMISGVAGKICLPRNCGGRGVFRKTEKKLVTGKSGSERLVTSGPQSLAGGGGCWSLALGDSLAFWDDELTGCIPLGVRRPPEDCTERQASVSGG